MIKTHIIKELQIKRESEGKINVKDVRFKAILRIRGGFFVRVNSRLCVVLQQFVASYSTSSSSSSHTESSLCAQFPLVLIPHQVQVYVTVIILVMWLLHAGPAHEGHVFPCSRFLGPAFTWRHGSRGWHIYTAARWTPAWSRSNSWIWAPGCPAGTRISARQRTDV